MLALFAPISWALTCAACMSMLSGGLTLTRQGNFTSRALGWTLLAECFLVLVLSLTLGQNPLQSLTGGL